MEFERRVAEGPVPETPWNPTPEHESRNVDHLAYLLNTPGRAPEVAPLVGRGNSDDAERWRKEREAEEREEVGEEVEIPPQRGPSDQASEHIATATRSGRGWRDAEREEEHQNDPNKDNYPEIEPGTIPSQPDPNNPGGNGKASMEAPEVGKWVDNGITRLDVIHSGSKTAAAGANSAAARGGEPASKRAEHAR